MCVRVCVRVRVRVCHSVYAVVPHSLLANTPYVLLPTMSGSLLMQSSALLCMFYLRSRANTLTLFVDVCIHECVDVYLGHLGPIPCKYPPMVFLVQFGYLVLYV